MFNRLSAITFASLVLLSPIMLAAESAYYGPGEVPRPIDVARALAGNQFRPSVKMRGISLDAGIQAASLGEAAPEPTHSDASEHAQGLDVAVLFAFDSDAILQGSFPALDSLAEGIKLLDAAKTVQIIGHTDATGAEPYNLQLSKRRANAVRDYLIKNHGIAAARLYGTGKGESEPLLPNAPTNAKNRRVSFALG